MRLGVFCVLLWVAFLSAFEIVEDSRSRFVFRDGVSGISPVSCADGDFRLLPENAIYKENSGTPYRVYRIAVPANAKPSVYVKDSVSTKFPLRWCAADSLKNASVEVSSPKLWDGVWVVDVLVPLVRGSGTSVLVRENFQVAVTFSGNPENFRPGNRLLSNVRNPQGAASFGTKNQKPRALRKSAGSDAAEVNWLARILVGDRENGSTAEDGLYAVTYRQIYAACREVARASDCEGIPIEKLRLYGAPQDTMPDVIWTSSDILPNRIFEIPIEIRDHSPNSSTADGTFDDGDTIFFAGYGTSLWKRIDLEDPSLSGDGMEYYYSSSPYSFYQYFQLGWASSGSGLRLSEISQANSGAEISVMRYVRTEKDAFLRDTYFGNEGGWEEATGKEWFWFWGSPTDSLEISTSSLFSSRNATLPHWLADGKSFISVSYFPHRSVYSSTMADGSKQSASNLSDSGYAVRMKDIRFIFNANGERYLSADYRRLLPGGNFEFETSALKSSGNSYSLRMLPNGMHFERFDGFSLAYAWNPAIENDTAEWILPGKRSGYIKVPFSASSDVRVLKFRNFRPVGLLPVKNGFFYDSVSAAEDVRYLVYNSNAVRKPAEIEAVPAKIDGVLEDIARISSKTEYLIIAPEAFQVPAVELGRFRSEGKAFKSYRTAVVLAEDIYRAYSGGAKDPVAIRNYLAYARSVSPNLVAAVLAGNGNFDYRGFHSGYKTNWLPPFEKENAVVEDFFAVLDSGEQVLRGGYDLDLNVGRLPLASVADFNAYNAKIEEHEATKVADNSSWRNSLIVSADDAWTGFAPDLIEHTASIEDLARSLLVKSESEGFRLDIKKIYLLDYTADASGQKLSAATDLINRINQGALFTIYFGHGSISDWAFEGLMKPSYVSSLSNESRYTILGSFSCTVGRFDKGDETSLSETFIQASRRGAIASIGATRESFSSYNRVFAKSFIQNALFPSGGTLGEAYRLSKNATLLQGKSQRENNERYALLGEPVVQMPVAELSVKLDQKVDTIRALDSMELSGSVSGISSGTLHLSILEQSYEKKLSEAPARDDSVAVLYDGAQIFSEDVDIRDGKFSVSFITPRKIAFGDTAAEIRLWASGNTNSSVGRTLVSGISISGTSPYADSIIRNDSLPPDIRIQSCLSPSSGTSFSEGETVTLASPACLQVTVSDSTAIDFREEADEGISFEVSGETVSASPFHPYPYLEQSSKKAVARMTFGESRYPAGTYTFKVSAQDIIGNTAARTVKVRITDGLVEGLSDVFTVPNPMKRKGATFYFKDLAVGRSANVTIFIYNQNGRMVQRIPNAVSGVTTWDGRDFYGRKLANGLYHYIVVSKVPAAEGMPAKTFRKKQKLVISR